MCSFTVFAASVTTTYLEECHDIIPKQELNNRQQQAQFERKNETNKDRKKAKKQVRRKKRNNARSKESKKQKITKEMNEKKKE